MLSEPLRASLSLRPFRSASVQGVAHPHLVTFFQRLPRLEQVPQEAGFRVYKEHPHLVREVGLPAKLGAPWARLVIKRFGKRFGWRGTQHYLFSPCKRSRASKAYRVACHLLTHGLRTPTPLGAFEARRWGFLQYEAYATEALVDSITLGQYCRTLPEGREGMEEVLRLVAVYVRRMHDSGLWYRDLNLENFLLTGSPGGWQLYLVDLNRARRVPYMPTCLRAFDLAPLDWREWQPRFCALYSTERFSSAHLSRLIRPLLPLAHLASAYPCLPKAMARAPAIVVTLEDENREQTW